jgi:hypothetical protein
VIVNARCQMAMLSVQEKLTGARVGCGSASRLRAGLPGETPHPGGGGGCEIGVCPAPSCPPHTCARATPVP